MKRFSILLSSVITVASFIIATQFIASGAGVKTVSAPDRLSIEQAASSGQWQGKDISLEYKYSKNKGNLELSGTVRFAMYLAMGYSRLENFRLTAMLLDPDGRVLQETGLVTNRGSFNPVSFSQAINLPANAVSVAFSYQGTGIESGTGGITSFSYYPVH